MKVLFCNGPRAGEVAEFMNTRHIEVVVSPGMPTPCIGEPFDTMARSPFRTITYRVERFCYPQGSAAPAGVTHFAFMPEPQKPTRRTIGAIANLLNTTAPIDQPLAVVNALPFINSEEARYEAAMKDYEFLKKVYEQGPRALRD